MWPETQEKLRSLMQNMTSKAAGYNRKVDFGLRVHVIVRETEDEARAHAAKLMSKLDADTGTEIRNRALDAKSYGVSRQSEMRSQADMEGFVEEHLWTGIGRARSGCGAAIVGNPDQVIKKLQSYMEMGIRSFILSGYPHIEEVDLFARYVLPHFNNISLPSARNRIPAALPDSPLGGAHRK